MNIGLLLQRATDLKWAGPFALEALDAKHGVQLFVLQGDGLAGKGYLRFQRESAFTLEQKGAKLDFVSPDDIKELALTHQIDFLVMQEGFHSQSANLARLQQLRKNGVQIVSLSHFFEICKRPIKALDAFDKTIYVSEFARDLHFELQAAKDESHEGRQKMIAKTEIASSPMFDQFRNLDRRSTRKALGFSTDERIVLLMAPVILPTTPWRFHVWRDAGKLGRLRDALRSGQFRFLAEIGFGATFKEVFEAIRGFSRRTDARLIVKSRGKQENLDFLNGEADLLLGGLSDEYFPLFSSYQLMAVADLCITVNSMAAAEAASMGVPCINIYVPHNDRAAASTAAKDAYNRALLGGDPDSLMNYPGAVRKVDRRNAIVYFNELDWDDIAFSSEKQVAYAEKFLGITEERSGRRILAMMSGKN